MSKAHATSRGVTALSKGQRHTPGGATAPPTQIYTQVTAKNGTFGGRLSVNSGGRGCGPGKEGESFAEMQGCRIST